VAERHAAGSEGKVGKLMFSALTSTSLQATKAEGEIGVTGGDMAVIMRFVRQLACSTAMYSCTMTAISASTSDLNC
jgi:hypothetical protein